MPLRLVDVKELFATCCHIAEKELNTLPVEANIKELFTQLQSDLRGADNYSSFVAFTEFDTLMSSRQHRPWIEVIVEFFTETKKNNPSFERLQKILHDCEYEIMLDEGEIVLLSGVDLLIYSPAGEDLTGQLVYSEVDIKKE